MLNKTQHNICNWSQRLLLWLQFGAEVHGMVLWAMGGLAYMGKPSSPKQDLIVALPGPLTHVPQVTHLQR